MENNRAWITEAADVMMLGVWIWGSEIEIEMHLSTFKNPPKGYGDRYLIHKNENSYFIFKFFFQKYVSLFFPCKISLN